MRHFGIDVHLRASEICEVDGRGGVVGRDRISTTEASLGRFFGGRGRWRVVLESSGMSAWVARLLEEVGHEVVVVNPRRMRLIAESTLKCDRVDAEVLARFSRLDPTLVAPVYQRSQEAQELRTRLRVRQSLVRTRTGLINAVRGTLRAHGYRMGSATAKRFVGHFVELKLSAELRSALDPLIETLAGVTARIEQLDRELEALSRSDELLERLQTVPGVGPLVGVSFVAWVDRAERFTRSRDVGACLGLRPQLRASGGQEQRGRITREGDSEMRRLLVQAAHAALRSRQDSALKHWAEQLAMRVGKKKALVALARKIGVLLHHLWVTGESFEPFPQAA